MSSSQDTTDLILLILVVVLIFGIYIWNVCSAKRQQQENLRRNIAARERAMRIVTVQNVAFTCDPMNEYPVSTPYSGRCQDASCQDSGVFPDSLGLPNYTSGLEIPPPSYEEALRINLAAQRNNDTTTNSSQTNTTGNEQINTINTIPVSQVSQSSAA